MTELLQPDSSPKNKKTLFSETCDVDILCYKYVSEIPIALDPCLDFFYHTEK